MAQADKKLQERSDLILKAAMGVAALISPIWSTGPMCPYARYVLEHGVETRVLPGVRNDN